MDRVVGGELRKHVKLVGYGSGSDTLKKKLKEYYKSGNNSGIKVIFIKIKFQTV
jgi:hypothetical protein